MRVSTRVVHASWRAPLASAHDEPAGAPRPLVLLGLETAGGVIGYGEAAPLESYDGVSLTQVLDALEACSGVLAGADGDDHAAALAACRACTDLPQAIAAIDLALWDIAGRQRGLPVWRLLGASSAPQVAVNAVIGAVSSAQAGHEAAAAVADGYGGVKVKIGIGDDTGRVAAVRAAIGPEVGLRVDANGAYATVEAALAALTELAEFDIELCEEPVHGADALAQVAAASPVPIAADESTTDPELLERRCCTAICLKIAAAGGISGLMSQAERGRALGYEIYLASTLDGPLGIAAALHCAAAIAPERACGLSTLGRFEAEPPFSPGRGALEPQDGPGLGAGLIDWYASPNRWVQG